LIKNYLTKLRILFQDEYDFPEGEIFTLKVISIRDKLSKLSKEVILKESLYFEVPFKKESAMKGQPLHISEDFEVRKIQISLKE